MDAPCIAGWRFRLSGLQGRRLLFGLTRHHGAVHLKAAGLGDNFVEAKSFIQHFRVCQEGVRDDTQLTAAVEVTNCATDQRLCRFQAGLHTVVERRG